jgi:hypothetical protein
MTPFACVWNGARLVQFDRLAVGHDVYNAMAGIRYLARIEMKIKSFMDLCKVPAWGIASTYREVPGRNYRWKDRAVTQNGIFVYKGFDFSKWHRCTANLLLRRRELDSCT